MSNRKIVLTLISFLLLLSCFRLAWASPALLQTNHEHAEQGVLNVTGPDKRPSPLNTLDGEWVFYPGQYLKPDQLDQATGKSFVSLLEGDPEQPIYGTYLLQINMPVDQSEQLYAIQLPNKHSIDTIYANGKVVKAENADHGKAKKTNRSMLNRTKPFTANQNHTIQLLMQVSDSSTQGFTKSMLFGPESAIAKRHITSIIMQFLVVVIALISFLYSSVFFMLHHKMWYLLYFGAGSLCLALATMLDDDKLLFYVITPNYVVSIKLTYLAYLGIAAFFLLFAKHLFKQQYTNRLIQFFHALHLIAALLILLMPIEAFQWIRRPIFMLITCTFFMIAFLMWQKIKKGSEGTIYLLLAAASACSSFIWAFYKTASTMELSYYPFDVLIAFFAFSIYLIKRAFRISEENKQLAIQLQKEIKRKDNFLANTSHELRNPLHGIVNIAKSLLHNRTELDDKTKDDLMLLTTIGQHMARTLEDLLDITRLKEHRIHLQKVHLDIQSVAKGVADMFEVLMDNQRVEIVVDITDDFPTVVADKNRLIQILFNLLHNAVKYTATGTITIRADIQDNMAQVHVADTGPGISEDVMTRIFEPYEQGDTSMTAGDGLGLGLNICKQLVQLHGGSLKVNSILNEGSTFTFTLPLDKDVQVTKTDLSSLELEEVPLIKGDPITTNVIIGPFSNRAAGSQKSNILAIDDDPVNLKVLINILSDKEYDVVTVTSGKAALELLTVKEWDLIISDVMMPGMSGYELTRAIRKKHTISELPVLLLTARSSPEDIYSGFLAGANDYVTKPVDPLELNTRVQALTMLKASVHERLAMEAVWLQAQIRPHFLFNTFNTIIALSVLDVTRMTNLLNEFAQFLRSSFDIKNLNQVVPIEQELALLNSYLYIEKERFEDRLQIHWDMDDIANVHVPPFALQTLVENAIHHGVLKRISGGIVTIRIRELDDKCVEIAIIDNGVGMNSETVQQLLINNPNKRKGIGLMNTDQRLKQLFGKGLHIMSTPNSGTTILFTVPVARNK